MGFDLKVFIIYVKNWNIYFDLVEAHYRADKKYKKSLGKLCFKRKLQADNFLVELIFILLSLISQGDSAIILVLHLSLCN